MTMSLETALGHLRSGDWQPAHVIVQDDASALGAWAHGIVHMMEGDFANARYWYRQAGRDYPVDAAPPREIEMLARALQQHGVRKET